MITKTGQERLEKTRDTVHADCIACGLNNTQGLQLKFQVVGEGTVQADFDCEHKFAGYCEWLQGGVIATLLDSAMTNCLFASGKVAVTAELNVRFHAPVAIGRSASVRAWLEKQAHGMSLVRSELSQDGCCKASAQGKFIRAEWASDGRANAV